MKPYLSLALLLLFVSCKNDSPDLVKDKQDSGTEYGLVWSDEFDYTGKPDPSKWNYELGFVRNEEEQYYTDILKNARTKDGLLILEAHKEKIPNPSYVSGNTGNWWGNREFAEYTAASLTTQDLAQWTYGKIEVRAKLPKGVGLWPAIWMLGENFEEVGWPKCGEIDIMEHVGFEKDSIYANAHTEAYNHVKKTARGGSVFIEDPYDVFHIFAIEWTPEKIDFLLDDVVYHHFENEHKTVDEWPFDQPFHMKLNIAVGGAWGGLKGIDNSIFPQQMLVDYVRVYQLH